jgi:energy-coupling factor transport system substrate-specific component
MVVLVALTAAMYAAVLIPFKLITIIPGITEVRPANVFPVICSLMFGPAGAWGAAFGNLIGDLFGGTYGLGSYFGMLGNFWFGYLPYRLWRTFSRHEPVPWTAGTMVRYLVVVLLASLACGVQIGWGLDLLGLVPFHVLAPLITVNNFIAAAILGPLLLPILYPRVRRWGLLYTDIMEPEDVSGRRLSRLGHGLLWVALLGSLFIGIAMSLGVKGEETLTLSFLGAKVSIPFATLTPWGTGVGMSVLPFMVLFVIGCLLI